MRFVGAAGRGPADNLLTNNVSEDGTVQEITRSTKLWVICKNISSFSTPIAKEIGKNCVT